LCGCRAPSPQLRWLRFKSVPPICCRRRSPGGAQRDPAIRDESCRAQFVEAGGHSALATRLCLSPSPGGAGDDNPHISADYLASMRAVEHASGAPCLGWGRAGRHDDAAMPGNRFEDAERMGVILGEAAGCALPLTGVAAQPAQSLHYRRQQYIVAFDNPLFNWRSRRVSPRDAA
jgi:hypothetical protein